LMGLTRLMGLARPPPRCGPFVAVKRVKK
jgi:hypothetical protein